MINRTRTRKFCTALLLICAAGWDRSEATPIIVGRTAQGFLIGTNFKRSDGSKTCKVQYNDQNVLIVAGQPMTGALKKSNALKPFDIDKELRTIRFSDSTPTQIMDSARQIIVKHLTDYGNAIINTDNLDVAYTVTVISFEFPQPQVLVQKISFSKVDRRLIWSTEKPTLPPGTIMAEVNKGGPTFISGVVVNKDAILQALRDATGRHVHSTDVSYAPPYVVLELNATGVHFLTNDNGLCTREPFTH